MAYKKKLHRQPLPKELTSALLSTPVDGSSVADTLERACTALKEAVTTARMSLKDNPLTLIVAQSVAKDMGRRGDPTIVVDDDGTVMLEIRYNGGDDKRGWHSNLPSLPELRREAEEKGIDISKLGRSKRKIADAIRKST